MPELSSFQYSLVYNAFSFTFAAMFASFIFFVLGRQNVAPKYRGALVMSALVVAVAGYHYFRIFESWSSAFIPAEGGAGFVPSGTAFNDAYRYVDWLLTVPLLTAELVAVLALPRKQSNSLTARLAIAAGLMIILGYPGEVADDNVTRAVWGFISTLPFVYIVWTLFTELGEAMQRQPEEARVLIRNARLLLLGTWGFYPIVYMVPFLGIAGASTVVAIQVGYCIADVAAKCGYGLLIYSIARAKTAAEAPEGVSATEYAVAAGD